MEFLIQCILRMMIPINLTNAKDNDIFLMVMEVMAVLYIYINIFSIIEKSFKESLYMYTASPASATDL